MGFMTIYIWHSLFKTAESISLPMNSKGGGKRWNVVYLSAGKIKGRVVLSLVISAICSAKNYQGYHSLYLLVSLRYDKDKISIPNAVPCTVEQLDNIWMKNHRYATEISFPHFQPIFSPLYQLRPSIGIGGKGGLKNEVLVTSECVQRLVSGSEQMVMWLYEEVHRNTWGHVQVGNPYNIGWLNM